MKKILPVLFFLLLTTLSFSQTDGDKGLSKVSLGVHFNPDFNIWSQPDYDNISYTNKFRFNYSLGLNVNVKFTKVIQLSVGALISDKGFNRTEHCLTCNDNYSPLKKYKLTYLDIPINVNFFVKNDRLDIYFIAGINQSIALKRKMHFFANPNIKDPQDFSAKDDISGYLIGGQAGLGINYNLTYRLSLGVDLTYLYYFNKVLHNTKLGLSNVSLKFGAYYRF